jgi:hypothetical protein
VPVEPLRNNRAPAIGLRQLQRRPEPRRLFRIDDVIGRQLKVLRHDADDLARDAVDLDGAAQHVRAVEARLPQMVAENHHAERLTPASASVKSRPIIGRTPRV